VGGQRASLACRSWRRRQAHICIICAQCNDIQIWRLPTLVAVHLGVKIKDRIEWLAREGACRRPPLGHTSTEASSSRRQKLADFSSSAAEANSLPALCVTALELRRGRKKAQFKGKGTYNRGSPRERKGAMSRRVAWRQLNFGTARTACPKRGPQFARAPEFAALAHNFSTAAHIIVPSLAEQREWAWPPELSDA